MPLRGSFAEIADVLRECALKNELTDLANTVEAARLAPAYEPRRPTETVLYRTVRENLETFLAKTREAYERPLPRYVEAEFKMKMMR